MSILYRVTHKPGYRVLLVIGLIIAGMNLDYQTEVQCEKTVQIAPTPQQAALTDYFRRAGSPHPERMATAVLETDKPRLLSAIAKVESGGKETAYNKKSRAKGAFQVKERHWGKVRPSAVEQALQADRILNDLYDEKDGNLRKALNAYGGDTKGRYAKMVLAELQQVPQ